MAKKKFSPTEQMNVRIPSNVLKQARVMARKTKLRLGQVVSAAIEEYLRTFSA